MKNLRIFVTTFLTNHPMEAAILETTAARRGSDSSGVSYSQKCKYELLKNKKLKCWNLVYYNTKLNIYYKYFFLQIK